MEITDEQVKKKHKEFNTRIMAALNRKGGSQMGGQFSPAIQKLRQLAKLRKSTLQRPIGG